MTTVISVESLSKQYRLRQGTVIPVMVAYRLGFILVVLLLVGAQVFNQVEQTFMEMVP